MASKQRRLIALSLGLSLYIFTGLNDTFWTSFFPTEMEKKGISKTTVGNIASAYDLAGLISSIFMLFIQDENMRLFMFCSGSVVVGVGCMSFGQLIHGPSGLTFITMSFITRCVMGCGSTLLWCSGATVLIALFPQHTGRICSLFESAASLGAIIGAPIGSLLFALGGYPLPFWVVGWIQIVLPLFCFLGYPARVSNGYEKIINSKDEGEQKPTGGVLSFILNPGVLCVAFAAIVTVSSFGFFNVAFSPHLEQQFDIGSGRVGLFFLSFTVSRLAIAPFFGYYIDKGYSGLIFITFGCFLSAICFAILALSNQVSILKNIISLEVILGIIGLSSTAAFLPIIVLFQKVYLRQRPECVGVVDSFAATMSNLCYTSGLILGQSIIGGSIFEYFGFFNSCMVEAIICGVATVLAGVYLAKNELIIVKNNRVAKEDPEKYQNADD
ncbi:MFS-type transporter SLC18B1-like [Convolutriloba macropyga]|uniref:MFS-type transporter SLC18B1-like n=1 Tax=Convolutriloba macropyga TaxID=536237 RepID=UPI003F5290F2